MPITTEDIDNIIGWYLDNKIYLEVVRDQHWTKKTASDNLLIDIMNIIEDMLANDIEEN